MKSKVDQLLPPPRDIGIVWRELQLRMQGARAADFEAVFAGLRDLQLREALLFELVDALRVENGQLRSALGLSRVYQCSWFTLCMVRSPFDPGTRDVVLALLSAAESELAARGFAANFQPQGTGIRGSGSAGGTAPAPAAALLFWRQESRGAPRRAVVFLHRAALDAAGRPLGPCRHEPFVAAALLRSPPAAAGAGAAAGAAGAAASGAADAILDGVFDDMAPDVAGAALAAPQNAAIARAIADFVAAH
eukprot:tig00020675_g12635.t1